METKQTNTAVQTAKPESITDEILMRVNTLKQYGSLKTPTDYSVENALKSAYLILQEAVDRDKKPVMQSCTRESIANALLNMVVKGLNPIKNQCYFIPFGSKLTIMPSYFGQIAMAKRAGLKEIKGNVIFENDVFKFKVDSKTGCKELIEHKQELENIDINKIKGAYAIYTMENGFTDMEIMTMAQIKKAWQQGAAKGISGAHTNFTDEMSVKTVINRACKVIINSSNDSYLYTEQNEEQQEMIAIQPTNVPLMEITPASEVKEEKQQQEQPVVIEKKVAEKTAAGVKQPEAKLEF